MHLEYQTLETGHDLNVNSYQASSTIQEELEEANSLGEFLKAGLIALVLMIGASSAVYFALFFLVTFGLGQIGQ